MQWFTPHNDSAFCVALFKVLQRSHMVHDTSDKVFNLTAEQLQLQHGFAWWAQCVGRSGVCGHLTGRWQTYCDGWMDLKSNCNRDRKLLISADPNQQGKRKLSERLTSEGVMSWHWNIINVNVINNCGEEGRIRQVHCYQYTHELYTGPHSQSTTSCWNVLKILCYSLCFFLAFPAPCPSF